eukprot:Blabericola_migrator_1__6557@NODE_3303_length_1878_cov_60_017670_g2064_i0_p1_GENE_NODE_3303_length_1878_cov_60_017670_g2064_i0NODE_3303_length_1878_cov_60_017670_g2064_i0_p1_ORF_typecomplete_len320_score45_75RNase_PH/PF01138_21/2_8e12DUF2062/PF09835_9/0_36_NODE_3303_length_1878_cov_60_017670_g2064_i07681727
MTDVNLVQEWDPSERVVEAAEANKRLDGRQHNEGRALTVQTSIFKRVYGSASVRRGKAYYFSCATGSIGLDTSCTAPAVSIRLQLPHILGCEFGLNRHSDAHLKNHNMEMTLNTWTDCICEQTSRILSNAINHSLLEIRDEPGDCNMEDHTEAVAFKYLWKISIDVTCLNYEGNLFDQVLLCALGALIDLKLPQVCWDKERRWWRPSALGACVTNVLTYLPIPVTSYRIGQRQLIDPDREESSLGFPMTVVYFVPSIMDTLNMAEDDDCILLNFISIPQMLTQAKSKQDFLASTLLVRYCEPCAAQIFTSMRALMTTDK